MEWCPWFLLGRTCWETGTCCCVPCLALGGHCHGESMLLWRPCLAVCACLSSLLTQHAQPISSHSKSAQHGISMANLLPPTTFQNPFLFSISSLTGPGNNSPMPVSCLQTGRQHEKQAFFLPTYLPTHPMTGHALGCWLPYATLRYVHDFCAAVYGALPRCARARIPGAAVPLAAFSRASMRAHACGFARL